MNKIFTVSFLLIIFSSGYSQTGGSWVKKADVSALNRESAIGFAANTKGYIGLGNGGGSPNGALWEFDFSTSVWTQKVNMTGGGRVNPVAFVIDGMAYVGTGEDISFNRDKKFYQFNPLTNAWTTRADFGGTARTEAVGFAIGSKGYVGTGYDGTRRKDFWEYDATSNTWTQKADFGGTARQRAVGFSVGTKGYIGTGYDGALKKDFWEYDPTTNTWTQKADLGGAARESAVGFGLSSKGYIATGDAGTGKNDIWEYNPGSDEWIQRANFTGQRRYAAAAFASSYSNKGYIGTGFTDEPATGVSTKDFYEFTPATPPLPPTNAMVTAYSETTIRVHWLDNSGNETGFIVERSTNGTTFTPVTTTAADATTFTDTGLTAGQIYYYRVRATKTSDGSSSATNIVSQTAAKTENGIWTLINDNNSSNPSFGDATATFSINGIIYLTAIGDYVGNPGATSKDCWAYDPATNTFTQKATFGGVARTKAVAFVLNNKGYVGTGYKGAPNTNSAKDLWQYDPLSNQWTQKADVGANGRYNAMVFTVGNKAYVGAGYLSTGTGGKDFYEYDPVLDTWTPKADFPFTTFNSYAAGYNNKGYALYAGSSPASMYEYDPTANTWTVSATFPVKSYGYRGLAVTKARLFTSTFTYSVNSSTLWEYEPANKRWIERTPHSTESQYSDMNVASNSDLLCYFSDKVVYTYNPLFGLKVPLVLKAEIADPEKITVSWSIEAGATGTEVYRSENEAGPYELIATLSKDQIIYSDEFDGVNHTAYYKVRAINNATTSDFTVPVVATPRGAWKQLNSVTQNGYAMFGDVSTATSQRGYLGINGDSNTWWEYNPESDSWTQKASFPGTIRSSPAYFSINDKVYVGLGSLYKYEAGKYEMYKDFWQYDPADNSWTKKKDFAGSPRMYTSTSSANGKGYLVGGDDNTGSPNFLNEAWEYNPADDSWTELPKLPKGVAYVSTFAKGNYLWVMNGSVKNSPNSWGSALQAYRYDFAAGTWNKEPNPLYYSSGSVRMIDDEVYFYVTGMAVYNVTTKTWVLKPSLPPSSSSGYFSYQTFALKGKIYAITNNYEVWVYNPEGMVSAPENLKSEILGDRIVLSWKNVASQPVQTKIQYASSTGSTAYKYVDLAVVNAGISEYVLGKPTPDFNYKFRAVAVNADKEQSTYSNSTFENSGPYWTDVTDFKGSRRNDAASFIVNGKIYYGTGSGYGGFFKDLWEFDPATNVWTQKADLPGDKRTSATTFVLGNDAYLGFGRNEGYNSMKDLWKYNAATNIWTASVDYPNGNRIEGPGVFVADGKAYLMGGVLNSGSSINELWRFDGTTWVQLKSLPAETRKDPIAFTMNGKAYIGSGPKTVSGGTTYGSKDFWEYTISTDTWRQLKDLPDELIISNRPFAITGANKAIVFTAPNGGSAGYGILTRLYSPDQDKWTSVSNPLHVDYIGTDFRMAQDPATGFTYAIIGHNELGTRLWRYEYLLDGPTLVEARMFTPGTARLKWRKMTPRPDSVVIYRSEISNAIGTRVGVVKTADTTATNGVSNGKTYYYRIRSYSNAGQFKTSSERMLVVDNPPLEPINLTGELFDDNIVLNWQPGAGGVATSYTIERALGDQANFQSLGTSGTTSFTTAEFAASTLSFRVKAVNGSGESPYSNVVTILVTGVEEEETTVGVYPNPTTDYITVEVDQHTAPLTMQLINNNGGVAYQNVLLSTSRIDMTHYPAGIYFVHLKGNKTALNKYIKIVKK